MRTGFGPNIPRGRNTGAGWGLSVESERTNVIPNSVSLEGNGWETGTMTLVSGVDDPAGGTNAALFESAGDQYSNYSAVTARAFSVWTRGVSGGPPFGLVVSQGVEEITSASWSRQAAHALPTTADKELNLVPVSTQSWHSFPAVTTPTSVAAWGAQAEPGALYASSFIPTANGPATRLAERLYVHAPGSIFATGYFQVVFVLAPRYASEQLLSGAEHDLLFFDPSNRTFVRREEGQTRVCQAIAADEVCTPPLSWSAEAHLTVETEHVPSGRALTVTGAREGAVSVDAPPGPNVSLGPAVDILGNGAPGAQECADLFSITISAAR